MEQILAQPSLLHASNAFAFYITSIIASSATVERIHDIMKFWKPVPTLNGDVLSSLLVRFFYSQLIIFSRPEIGTGKGVLVLILLHDMLSIDVK